ncbi:MAG: bacterial transcriptional activator domain-containing protein [Actinomycetota bacterium]
MDGPLRIYLAGNIALERGDALMAERRLPGSQGRLAFALLVSERSNALSTAHIADILWDGTPPASWGTALRAVVSKLRSALAEIGGDVTIEHAFGCYQLRMPPDTWVDMEAAAAAVHDAEVFVRAGDLVAAHGEALVANAIARRPFLEGMDGDWVQRQRAQLRAIHVRALSCRTEIALLNGDHGGAASDAERIIVLEPFKEQAYVLLIRAHIAAGNNAEALATYERLREKLASELGVSPSPDTEAVFLEVLRVQS